MPLETKDSADRCYKFPFVAAEAFGTESTYILEKFFLAPPCATKE